MKLHFPLISIFLFTSLFGYSQSGLIKGKLLDADNQEPIIAATIQSGGAGTTTDLDGNYELQLPAGKHTLRVSYLGYETLEREVELTANEIKVVDLLLSTTATLLQTATVTSGKFEKPLGEVTVSMEVLKPRLIENNNTTSVDEVLEKLPGVSIVDGQANIRGGSGYSYGAGSRVLLLVDDIPALQADAGFPNWDDLPVENVEQIEVIKGAASALYGSSALNGIINVRTAYAKSEPETKVSSFYNVYLSPKDKAKQWWDAAPFDAGVSLSHKQKINKLDLVLGGFYLHRNSFRESSDSQYGRVTLGTRYRASDRLSVGFNSNFNLGQSDNYFYWRDGEANAYRGDTSTYSGGERFRAFIDPFLTYYDKAGNRHKLLGRFYGVNNIQRLGRSNQSNLFYGEYQFQKQFEEQDFVITAGTVFSGTGITAELYGDTTYTSRNIAGYVQLDKKFFDRLNFSTGIRYERNALLSPELVGEDTITGGKTIEAKPVFRFGLNYQLAPFTYLRSSWGQGYRFPTVAEKFIFTSLGVTNIVPNPELQSETGWTAELGIKQGFRLGGFEGFVDVSGFWSEYRDMIEFGIVRVFPLPFQARNVGNTVIRGVDISVAGQGKIGNIPINVLAGYTYIDPRFKDFTEMDSVESSVDYNILKYRNRHSLKLDVEAKFGDFTVGVAHIYNSHVEAIDFIFEEIIPGLKTYRQQNNNGYRLWDLRFSYQLNKLKISVIGKNIFNEEYTLRPALLEGPRNLNFRLDYRF
ncbi:MAG: TonB-dependent receptor [Bacteroidota bacterium]